MPQLRFKKQFHPAIVQGRKTTTLRRWNKSKLKPGDCVRSPGLGVLLIKSVEPVQWESLSQRDAASDGFESLADLNAAIRRIYPNMDGDGKAWFKVTFTRQAEHPRAELAAAIRRELDKAVRGSRSLPAS